MSVCIIDLDAQDRSQNAAFEDASSLSSNLLYVSDDSWLPGSPVASKSEHLQIVDQTLVNTCMGCSRPFDIVVSKHHCRGCGQVFCSSCASFKVAMEGYSDRQRACLTCVSKIVAKAKGSTSSPPASPVAPKGAGDATLLNRHLDTPWSPEEVVQGAISNHNKIADGSRECRNFMPKYGRGEPPKRIFQASTGFILGKAIDAAAQRGSTKESKTPVKVFDENENVTTIRFGSGSFDRKMSVLRDMTNRVVSNDFKETNKTCTKNRYSVSKEDQSEHSFESSRLDSLLDRQKTLLMSPAAESREGDGDSMDFLVDEDAYNNTMEGECDISTSPMLSPVFAKMSPISTEKVAQENLQNHDDECPCSSEMNNRKTDCEDEALVADGSFDQSVVFESFIQEDYVSSECRDEYSLNLTSSDPSPMTMRSSKIGWILRITFVFVLSSVLFIYSNQIMRRDEYLKGRDSVVSIALMSSTPTAKLDVQQDAYPVVENSAEINQSESLDVEVKSASNFSEEVLQISDVNGDSNAKSESDGESQQIIPNDSAENSLVCQEKKRFPHKLSWVGLIAKTATEQERGNQDTLLSDEQGVVQFSPLHQLNFKKEIAAFEKVEENNDEVPTRSTARALVPVDLSNYNTHSEKGLRISDLYGGASRRIISELHPALLASFAGALFRKLGAIMRTTISFIFRKVYIFFATKIEQ